VRQLIVIEFVTLDGVMQGLGSPDEDRDGGFAHGGWGAPYGDDVQQAAALEGMRSTGAYLFGRRTYEKMVTFWPQQPEANPMAAHLNATPKYVATQTLQDADLAWANARVLRGDLAAAVHRLKAEGDGTIAVLGSGVLVQQLTTLDLVDGYRLFLHPLLLGSGKRLFNQLDRPRPLQLLSAEPTSTGVVMLSYDCLLTGDHEPKEMS
jgi:dihydrofolate reductase